jgi:hypothetical protein
MDAPFLELSESEREAASLVSAAIKDREWIPVAERIPPVRHNAGQSSDDVFVALQYQDGGHLLSIGYYSHYDKVWRIRAAKHGWQPTHWMPLPAPPQADK